MRYSYVSMLSTESYLPGVLVLHDSLVRTKSQLPFLLLITPNISDNVQKELAQAGIAYKILETVIPNPNRVEVGHRWYYNYSKLQIFNQVEFEKIVFLDADMLVNQNIDELFQKPHMSAVNSGGLLPELASWINLNSGLLVVEPSAELFSDMLRQVGVIEHGKAGGDQSFLHAYFHDWPQTEELHLDHRYNMFHTHLDRYNQVFGYTLEEIKVFHFIGENKPWETTTRTADQPPFGWRDKITLLIKQAPQNGANSTHSTLRDEAVRMWQRSYDEMKHAVVSSSAS